MSRRSRNLALAIASLVLGGLLYILFRPNTYVAVFCSGIPLVAFAQKAFAGVHNLFLTGYFVDFLWGLALYCGLLFLHDPEMEGRLGCAGVAFLSGCLWELLQWRHVVSGTGDWLDICMYFLSVIFGVIINLKEKKYEKDH